ncbi:MAG: hypothetical protein VX328_04795, partial [Candidatus Thermoplasmatota archaeon]|nr:hypothetical protein [Candidatus Thermoplasmatota archaeon]
MAQILTNLGNHDPTFVAFDSNNKWHGFGGGYVRVKIDSLVGGHGASVTTPAQAAGGNAWSWRNANVASSESELFKTGHHAGDGTKRWKSFANNVRCARNGLLHPNPNNNTFDFTTGLTGHGSNADRFTQSLGQYRVVDTFDYTLAMGPAEYSAFTSLGLKGDFFSKNEFNKSTMNTPALKFFSILEQTASIRLKQAITTAGQTISDSSLRFSATHVPHHIKQIFPSHPQGHRSGSSLFSADDYKGIKITTDTNGSLRNALFEYIPISFSAGKATLNKTYSHDELMNPIETNIIRMSGAYGGADGTNVDYDSLGIPDVRTINFDFSGTGGENLSGNNALTSSTTLTGGTHDITVTNGAVDGNKVLIKIPTGGTNAENVVGVVDNAVSAITGVNGLSGINAVKNVRSSILVTVDLTYTANGAHDIPIDSNNIYDNAVASHTGMKGGSNDINETNGQAMSNGNIAVQVNDCNSISELQTRFKEAVETAQADDFTLSIGTNSPFPVNLTMPYSNSASAGKRKITGTGHFSSRADGFSRGINPLTFNNGSRVDAATGYTGTTNARIAIPVGTKTTYNAIGTSAGTATIALRIESSVESNNTTIAGTTNSNTVNFAQNVASARGNHEIAITNIGGSGFGSTHVSHFQGGRDAITHTNGQAMSNGNIAVTVNGANSVSAIQAKFKSAVETAQAGHFTLTIGGASSYPVNLAMPYANSASAGDRKITGTGHFSSRVGGFSRGINPITFTNGQRVDAGTGWTGGTNTKKAILVGTSTTYAQVNPGNQTTTAIAGFIKSVVESNNS